MNFELQIDRQTEKIRRIILIAQFIHSTIRATTNELLYNEMDGIRTNLLKACEIEMDTANTEIKSSFWAEG